MSRINNDKREIFVRLHLTGMKAIDIAFILGVTRRTVDNWITFLKSNPVDSLYIAKIRPSRPGKVNIEAVRQEFESNKFAFNSEIAEKFNCCNQYISRLRHKLGYTRKKARTVYKEANEELKKNSQKL